MRLIEFIKHVNPSWVEDWYHSIIVEHLEMVARGETDLLVSSPPGSGKTQVVSILFPAWLIAEDPMTHIISLANSDSLSRLAASNILRIVQSPAFQELCPLELDKATEQTFLVHGNDGRPTLHSAGWSGQLTGHRAKFLIFDDLIKSLSDSYSETIREKIWSNFNSAAETRLLPSGRICGIHTRWHLSDPIGKLVRRALENKRSRQFTYINLAASNTGSQSYILRTKTNEMEYLPAYKSLATIADQPYSFGVKQLKGKEADLGPTMYSALYLGNPVTSENQMFPSDVWGSVDSINTDDYLMIVSAWDTASRAKSTNDPSANVVIGRRRTGDFVVLDVAEFKLTFDQLLPVVMERSRRLAEHMRQIPVLVIEEASSGQQLIDIIRSQFPRVPLVAAKAVKSKIIRAEGVTPFTTARSVSLLKAEWNGAFIADMSNFPASDRDHYTDSFCHGMRCFTGTGSDFKKPEWNYLPPAEELSDRDLAISIASGELDIACGEGIPDLDDELRRF